MTDVLQVRGVAEEVQRKAKAAAAYCGVTLGKWMTAAIERTAEKKDVAFAVEARKKNAAEGAGVKVGEVYRDEIAVVENVTTDPPLTVENLRTMKAQLMGDAAKPRKPRKVCAHGIAKGENCWQCNGKAKVE